MSANLVELVAAVDQLLQVGRYQDYCPNGLQVEGRGKIRKLVSGVTASQALLDAAVKAGADALLVHHGYFWKGEDPCLVGIKKNRLAQLLRADISLIAYHLPLDDHPTLGNNAQLARVLGFDPQPRPAQAGDSLVWLGRLSEPMSGPALADHIDACLGRRPLHIDGGAPAIETVAWCTGAAQGFIEEAAQAGAQAFISGEVSEQTVHIARERGLHFYAAGHHATERYGVKALGEYLAAQFAIEHQFIDIDNPV